MSCAIRYGKQFPCLQTHINKNSSSKLDVTEVFEQKKVFTKNDGLQISFMCTLQNRNDKEPLSLLSENCKFHKQIYKRSLTFILLCKFLIYHLTIRSMANCFFPYIFIGSWSFDAVASREAKFSQISRYFCVTTVSEKSKNVSNYSNYVK